MSKKTFWWLVVASGMMLASISLVFAQVGGQTPGRSGRGGRAG